MIAGDVIADLRSLKICHTNSVLTPLARQFKRDEPGWNWRRECGRLIVLLISTSVVSFAAMLLDWIPLNSLVPIAFGFSFLAVATICAVIIIGTFPFIRYVPISLARVTFASLALMTLAFGHILVIDGFWNFTRGNLEAYPFKVAPQLEAYRQVHGSYPIALDELPNIPTVPKFLEYTTGNGSYTFTFADQSQGSFLPVDYVYSRQKHQWETDY